MDGSYKDIIHFPDVNIRVGVELTNGYVDNYPDIADAIISVLDMGGSKSNTYIGTDELQAVASMLASLENGHDGKPLQIDDGAGGGINIIWQLNDDYPNMIDEVDDIQGQGVSWSPNTWWAYKDGIDELKSNVTRILSKHKTASRKSHGKQVISEHFLQIKLKHDSEKLFIRKRKGPVEETIRDAVRGALRPILKNNAKLLNENININIGPLKKAMAAPDLCIYEEEPDPVVPPVVPPTTPTRRVVAVEVRLLAERAECRLQLQLHHAQAELDGYQLQLERKQVGSATISGALLVIYQWMLQNS